MLVSRHERTGSGTVGAGFLGWDGGAYGGESKRVDFDTESRNVLLFEFTSQVTLDEGGL